MTAEEQKAEAPIKAAPAKRRKRRGFFHGLRFGSFVLTLALAGLVGVALYLASGRSIDAPAWLRDEIEARIAANALQGQLRFGRMQLVMVEGFRPRLRLTDVRLENADGAQIVGFSQMDTALALAPLFEGRVQPQEILISGVFATLQRARDGNLSLSGGFDLSGPTRQAPSLAVMLKGLDALFQQEALAGLALVDIQALTLRYDDLAGGQSWTIDGGRGRVTRAGEALAINADLALLSGGDGIATVAVNYSTMLGAQAAQFGATMQNMEASAIAAQGPALAWLGALRAPISGSLRSGVEADGTLAPLNATLSIGAGAVQPTPEARPIPFEAARAYFSYAPQVQELRFDELFVDSQWVRGRAEGVAWLDGLDGGGLTHLVGQLRISDLALNPFGLYPAAQQFPRASADVRLSLEPFRLEVGEAVLDLDGENLVIGADVRVEAAGWGVAVDGHVDALTSERVVALWPESFEPKARKWLSENILNAEMRDVNIALRGQPGAPVAPFVSFDFEEARVRYLKTLPVIEAARGHASLAGKRLVVSVDEGVVRAPEGGPVNAAGSSFIIPDTSLKPTPGIVRLNAESSITAALSLINQPPLRLMEKAGRAVDIAQGRALIEGEIRLPLRKGAPLEEVDYAISGQLTDVSSRALMPNRELSAGALILEATPDAVLVGGPGNLDGVPFEAAWSQTLGANAPGVVSGTIPIDQATLDAFRIGLPPGTLQGRASGEITVQLPRNAAPQFSLTSSLRGARLSLPPLGWSKGRDAAGRLAVSGLLGETPRIDRLEISAPGLTANGSVSLNANGSLAEARFERVRVGDWLDAPVRLVGRGAAPPAVRVTAGRIDLRRASFGGGNAGAGAGGGGGAASGPLTLSLERLQVSDTIALTDFAGQFAEGVGLRGRFTARVNGGAAIDGRVVPQNGRSAFQITSADAGGVLAGANVLKQARGGEMTLTLLPVPGAEGVLDGQLNVSDTRIRNAPAMAELLSAISIVGLLDQLGGNGISFSSVEADFRMAPAEVVLRRASAVGPSMGISMEGRYGLESGAMDMRGVISPVYFLNAIGQIFSRRGEGLIGFNYRIRGTSEAPRVQVNPLSALTPGFFREIFRAPPPDLPAADAPRALLPGAQAAPARKTREQVLEERRKQQDER